MNEVRRRLQPIVLGVCLSTTAALGIREGLGQANITRPPVLPIDLSYLRLDLIIPGARPSGLGGAFIAAALDETASAINPAGLAYLTRPGASLHQRQARTSIEVPVGSSVHPDGRQRFTDHAFDQNMVNIVYPLKRFSFSTFRQVPVDTRFDFTTEQFMTANSNPTPRFTLGGLGNFPGRQVNLDLQIVNNGLAIAFAASSRLSLGLSVKVAVLNFNFSEHRFLDPEVLSGSEPDGNTARTTYAIRHLEREKVDVSASFGLLGELLRDRLFAGAVVNINPRFELASDIFLPRYEIGGTVLEAIRPHDRTFRLAMPDTYGLGLYYVASDRLRFSFDLVRVEYRDLLKSNDRNLVEDDVFEPTTGTYSDPDGRPDLTVDDVFELHFGVEYLSKLPWLGLVPLRFGLYTDPAHRIHTTSDDPNLQRLYPKDDNRLHLTFGTGVILSSSLKFDGSINYSNRRVEIIGSTLITLP